MAVRVERSLERRQEVVDAAVRIADRDGLDRVSMRNLADELGVGTMTLYTYVADKDELLDLMLDEVSRHMLVPEPLPTSWREALRAIAIRTRDAVEHHPWVLDAGARRPRQRINTMRHVEQSLAAVAPLGLDREVAGTILTAVDDYTVGHSYRKRTRQKMRRAFRAAVARGGPGGDPAVEEAIEAGELPLLAKAFRSRRARRPVLPPDPDFERGLDWLLDGIEASVAAADQSRASPASERAPIA